MLDYLRQEGWSIQDVPEQLPPVQNISVKYLRQVNPKPSDRMHEGLLEVLELTYGYQY